MYHPANLFQELNAHNSCKSNISLAIFTEQMSNTTFLFCQTVTSVNRIDARITLLSPRKFVRGA